MPSMIDAVLDTTIHEPPMTVSEVDMLLFALDRSHAQFAWKCGGLDAAGLSKSHPPTGADLLHEAVDVVEQDSPQPW